MHELELEHKSSVDVAKEHGYTITESSKDCDHNHICAECPARFRCQDAFAHPGPGLCNLSALLEDLAGCLNDLATDAGARAETTNLVYELRMSAQVVARMRYCIDVLGMEENDADDD